MATESNYSCETCGTPDEDGQCLGYGSLSVWLCTECYAKEAPEVLAMEREDQYTCGCNDKECDECQCSECGNCTDPSVKTCHHSKFCRCEDEEEPTCASTVPVSSQSATTPQTVESMDSQSP